MEKTEKTLDMTLFQNFFQFFVYQFLLYDQDILTLYSVHSSALMFVLSKLFDKYGGEDHLKAPPRELIFSQTEDYVEYSRSGKVIKGQEANTTKSRYTEDVFPGNHTSVWGSYWYAGRWGYKCCHSFIKQSYCTGDAGKAAFATNSLVNSVKGKLILCSTSLLKH